MKITRIKLVNFTGIKHGADLDEIEIKFGQRKITMISGGNASGKTTLLSQLHPFKDSFDSRRSVIPDGEEGRKEIDLLHDNNEYEIIHIYGKKAQSFIKKNGTEMNENGGVRTFEAYIESEFGLTNDYFKIGKIGSNTQNFIDLTTSERKTYIAKFLPAIEDYLEKFEIIKEKFRDSQSEIKIVSADLEKLEEEEFIKTRIATFEELIRALDADISKSTGEIAVLKSEIATLNEDIAKVDLPKIVSEIATKEARRIEIGNFGKDFVAKYGKQSIEDLQKVVDENTPIVAAMKEELAVLNGQKSSHNEVIIGIKNDIAKYTFNLTELKNVEDVKELTKSIETKKQELVSLKKDNSNPLFKLVFDNKDTIAAELSKFENFKNHINKYFKDLNQNTILPTKANIELFLEENFERIFDSQAKSMRELIEGKEHTLSSKIGLLAQQEADFIKYEEIYRDKDINDPYLFEECRGCPFAQDAFEYKELPAKIEKLQGEIEVVKKDIVEFKMKAENLADQKIQYRTFVSLYEQMNPRTNKVYLYFVENHGSLVENVKGDLNSFSTSTANLVADIKSYLFNIQKINVVETEISNLEYRKNISENNKTLLESVQKNISSKEEDLRKAQKKLEELTETIEQKKVLYEKESSYLNDFVVHLAGRREWNSLATMISNLKSTQDKYNENKTSVATKTDILAKNITSLNEVKERRLKAEADLLVLKTNMSKVTELKIRKESLEKNYNDIKTLRDALDPNKGVPLYFIKAYLEQTKDIANELLELAFDGNFEINFITTDKDFFIQVRSGENVKNDIKEASQGEVALTTISISLSLIEQAIGDFNILSLDEIDASLDAGNRQNFISIINTQIAKLGIEQVFVISHNDAFDTEEMDLILLKGNNIAQKGDSFLANKTIIYEL